MKKSRVSTKAVAQPSQNNNPATPSTLINNDELEKKQRRESLALTKQKRQSLAFGALAGSLLPSVLNSDQQQNNGNQLNTNIDPVKRDISAVEELSGFNLSKLSLEEIGKKYEEWMKIAADNKINSNNSWNVQLIDYFHELSLMREGDSINFTKASCTLDGCVKVYTNRVDAVATETNRLLSGLAENNGKKQNDEEVGDNHAADGYGDDDSDTEKARKKRRVQTQHESTIEKNPQNLNVKKFDLEFTVDPLFKKTCADFDEGGASGLLLGHLSLYGNGRIIFDASDVETATKDVTPTDEQLDEQIDATELVRLLGDNLKNLSLKTICPSLRQFKFSDPSTGLAKDVDYSEANLTMDDMNIPELYRTIDFEVEEEKAAPASVHFAEIDDGDDISESGVEPLIFDDDANPMLPPPTDIMAQSVMDSHQHFEYPDHQDDYNFVQTQESVADPMLYAQRENSVLTGPSKSARLSLSLENMYSYFDSNSLKNWAGPAHWRIQRSFAKRPLLSQDATVKKQRKEKTPFYIDFDGPEIPEKSLFSKERKSQMTLPKSRSDRCSTVLPLDVHYSMKDFCSLFLKPKLKVFHMASIYLTFKVALKRDHSTQGTVWALDVAGNDYPENGDNEQFGDFDEGDDGPMNFASQFDIYDDEMKPSQSQVSSAWKSVTMEETKYTKFESINYAKRAKRVDIQKLKENIWVDLTNDEPEQKDGNKSLVESEKKFSEVIESVSHVYPEEKAKDISVSFYFICLLHLANEQNLTISGNDDLSDFTIAQEVGK